jgi:hypothetical protein
LTLRAKSVALDSGKKLNKKYKIMKKLEQLDVQNNQPRRPGRGEILNKVDLYRRAEEDQRGSGRYMIDEVTDYIAGRGEEETKDQFYHGWTKEDFEEMLRLIQN